MKSNRLFRFPAEQSTSPSMHSVENGEHLGIIMKAMKKNERLHLKLVVSPDEYDSEVRITYDLAEDWRCDSEFIETLVNLGVLLNPGAYFDPKSLVGLPVMVQLQVEEETAGDSLYSVLALRYATKDEIARVDYDDEDDSEPGYLVEDDIANDSYETEEDDDLEWN